MLFFVEAIFPLTNLGIILNQFDMLATSVNN